MLYILIALNDLVKKPSLVGSMLDGLTLSLKWQLKRVSTRFKNSGTVVLRSHFEILYEF